MLIHKVHAIRHTWRPLFPYKRGLQPVGPSSLTRLGWFRLSPIDQYSSLLPPVGVWSVSQYQCLSISDVIFNKYPHAGPLFHAVLVRLSTGYPPLIGKLHTRYSPVRRSPPVYCYTVLPLDLHVLSLSLAFILSQDQTLRCSNCSLYP